jgi:hypothetical protein
VLRVYAHHWAQLYENERAKAIMEAFSGVVPAISSP